MLLLYTIYIEGMNRQVHSYIVTPLPTLFAEVRKQSDTVELMKSHKHSSKTRRVCETRMPPPLHQHMKNRHDL